MTEIGEQFTESGLHPSCHEGGECCQNPCGPVYTKEPEQNPAEEVRESPVYYTNLSMLNSLDEMEQLESKYKRRERFWRSGGPFIAIAPLVAAGVLMATPPGQKMDTNEKINVDAYAFVASLFLGMTAFRDYDTSRKKGQKIAEDALPVSRALNNRTQAWIARRLEERHADELKAKQMRGQA